MNFLTFRLQFPLCYMNICSLCHLIVWQYFEHMPNETDEEKNVPRVHKALGTVSAQGWDGHNNHE